MLYNITVVTVIDCVTSANIIFNVETNYHNKTMEKHKLACLIVTYNRQKLLVECIESCLHQKTNFDYVLVVNNGSTDHTKEILLKYSEKIQSINLDTNFGGAGGFYFGIKHYIDNKIDFDYLLLIDDDAILSKDFNNEIVKKISNEYDAYSGTVITKNNIQKHHRSRLTGKGFKYKNVCINEYENDYFEYDICSFCGLYISKDLIKRVGYPDKDFFIWNDDIEYSLRINKYTKILNVNKAVINHKCDISNNTLSWKTYYLCRNRLLILKRYYPFSFVVEVILDFLRGIKNEVLYIIKHNNSNRILAKMHFISIYEAIFNKLGKNDKYVPGIEL